MSLRRNKIEIFYDILYAVNTHNYDNLKPTQIQLSVNMSYDKFKNNWDELVKKGFIQSDSFIINEKGLKFLQDFKDIKNIVKQIKTEYFGSKKSKNYQSLEHSVLVVDDDEDLLEILSETIQQFGYNVIKARDGKDAIEKYKQNPSDLVLMDINMPEKNGFESFFALRKNFPNVKVIFMTGYQDLSTWKKAKNKGAIYLIKKPFSAEFLNELIDRHIKEPNL